jgi:hypothetical protein
MAPHSRRILGMDCYCSGFTSHAVACQLPEHQCPSRPRRRFYARICRGVRPHKSARRDCRDAEEKHSRSDEGRGGVGHGRSKAILANVKETVKPFEDVKLIESFMGCFARLVNDAFYQTGLHLLFVEGDTNSTSSHPPPLTSSTHASSPTVIQTEKRRTIRRLCLPSPAGAAHASPRAHARRSECDAPNDPPDISRLAKQTDSRFGGGWQSYAIPPMETEADSAHHSASARRRPFPRLRPSLLRRSAPSGS